MDNRRIETFVVEAPRREVLRLLGMPAGGRSPRPSTVALIDEALVEARGLVEGRAVMRFSHAGLPGSAHVPAEAPLVAVVCTIGATLERRVAGLAAGGESARAAVLDAVGSAAAEAVAEASNRLVCQLAAPTDLRPRSRRSPGYGQWAVEEQRPLFAFLAPEEIGVTLTVGCMMVPRKSVSYVVRLDGPEAGASGDRCSLCADGDCPYRDIGPHAGAVHGDGGGSV